MRAAARTIVVTALAVGLLAVFVRNADLGRVWSEMRAARADLLVLSVLATIAMYFVRAERWQYLLEPLGHTRFWVAFKTTVVGFAATMVLPARAGEVLRPYLLAKSEGLPATATFATIIVERILDLVCGALSPRRLPPRVWRGGAACGAGALSRRGARRRAMGLAALVVLVVMFVMAGHPERLHGLVLRLERVLPERLAHVVARFARTFAEGLAVVRRPWRLAIALGWSLVLWLLIATYAWLVARAFGIVLPFVGSFLLSAILVVGVASADAGRRGRRARGIPAGRDLVFRRADNDVAVGGGNRVSRRQHARGHARRRVVRVSRRPDLGRVEADVGEDARQAQVEVNP